MSPKASNWVDRGEPPEDKLSRCLAGILGLAPDLADAWVRDEASTILHMVAANASEVEVATYLDTIEERRQILLPAGRGKRTAAIALWHVAKAGLVYGQLQEIVKRYGPRPTSDHAGLADWLTDRLRAIEAEASTVEAPSRVLSAFLANWQGAPHAGWTMRGLIPGTLESVTLRLDLGEGPSHTLTLRAATRGSTPVIELETSALTAHGSVSPGSAT